MRIKDHWTDQKLEAEITRLQTAIEMWAKARYLWSDCGFASYIDHVDGEPTDPPIVTLLWCEGELRDVLFGEDSRGYETEFSQLLNDLGYWYENRDGVTSAIYPVDESLANKFLEYFHWQWVCSLIKEDTADVYEELYAHFANRPDDLYRLNWRDFEILLFRIFQSHGFQTELGPGRGDGGIDLRFWQRDPIGDILTVVQAKRYSPHIKIDQTQVAALYGVSHVENAEQALFVTTSSYAPVAKRFAARTSGKLQLAEKKDIVDWCERSTNGIICDKSSLVSASHVSRVIGEVANTRYSRIVHATYGYNMNWNSFALVIKESQHAALLMGLEKQMISDDGYGQRGMEVPKFDATSVSNLLRSENVWRAKRFVRDGRVTYWDGRNLFSQWDGMPAYFDYMD